MFFKNNFINFKKNIMRTKILNKENKIFRLMLLLFLIIILSQRAHSEPEEDWVSRYNGFDGDDKAQAMALDREGNIYVTGYSEGKGTGKDFLTIKYSQKGELIWIQRFEGIGAAQESDDEANAIAVDGENNVYVTGFTLLGRAGRDFCTIKYNEKGEQEWISFFSGLGNIEDSQDEATSIAADGYGNVYVIGNSNGALSGYDICVVKYDREGNELWARALNGGANSDDKAVSVKTDKEGFVYVAGTTEEIAGGKDYFLAKLDKAGELEWSAKYNGAGGNISINDDEINALEVDGSGNSYVTGYSYGGITGKDFCTIKYDSKGKAEWVSRIDNSQLTKNMLFDDEAKAIAVTASGEVYVTGRTTNSERGSDYLTAKIGLKGETLWIKKYNSELITPSYDEAKAIAIDGRSDVYVTGFINGEEQISDCGNEKGKDFCTIKYSSAGRQMWVRDFNGSGHIGDNDDIPIGILVDAKGRIYIAGQSTGDETKSDYCLIKYSPFYPIKSDAAEVKDVFKLNDNFPNPFNPTTRIGFSIPSQSNVKLAIYDITGKEIALLVNNHLQPGNYQYEWNALQFSSGTYFYKLDADGFVQTKKMILIK
jgi:uncharacterized delta-60 repeat protein